MAYISKDGRHFQHPMQGRQYDEWLSTTPEGRAKTVGPQSKSAADRSAQAIDQAPGGPSHEEAFRLHGIGRDIHIRVGEGGRYEVESKHADGFVYRGVHPQAHVAGDVVGHLLGVNPPMGLETHLRGRAQPSGPKEEARVAHEDHREVGEEVGRAD